MNPDPHRPGTAANDAGPPALSTTAGAGADADCTAALPPACRDPGLAALYQRLLAYEFDDPQAALPFSRRLARDNGWTHRGALRAIDEYRRFVFLALAAGHPVTPSDQVDQVWHLHLVYTRMYWLDFCPQVLGRSLHHGPTRGGAAEGGRYDEQYRRTLASYERCFGHPPPADLWPAPELRFGRDLGFVRVNRHACWLLPRSPEAWRFVLHRRLGRLLRSLRRTLARFGLASEPAQGPVRGPGRKS